MKDRQVSLYFNKTKYIYGNNEAIGDRKRKQEENAMRINPELRTLTDKAELDGTQVTHLKVTTEQFERYGLADHCVAVDDERLELKIPVHG